MGAANSATLLQGQHVVTVLELCSKDLHDVLRSSPTSVPPAVTKRWMRDILRGVDGIHSAGATKP
jgi:serine/threonine protein kinase